MGLVDLTVAVSEAGGLGLLTALSCGTPEEFRQAIRDVRARTKKPFGVNLTILPAMVPPDYDAYAKVIIDEGIKVVETAGSSPKKWVTLFNKHGIFTIHKAVTIKHCLSAQKYGVKCLSVDAFACGGHPGEGDVDGMVLFAKAGRALDPDQMWIASGGIATGTQLAACLALGADGINCGTRFAVSKESPWPESFKKRVMDADESQTALLFRNLHNTARVFKNKVAAEVEEIEKKKGLDLEFSDVAHLVAGTRGREAEKEQ